MPTSPTKSERPLVFLNQSTGTLCVDIINVFAAHGRTCVLLTGTAGFAQLDTLDKRVKIDRVCRYDKTRLWRRLFTWVWATAQMWAKVFFKYGKAELFIVTNPPFATFLPLLCRNRFWVLVYDIYPEVLVQAGFLRENGVLARFWRWTHRRVYGKAQGVFTIGQSMADCLARYLPREKITIIDNWADTDFIRPVPVAENRFIQTHRLQGKFVVLYAGNIGNTHSVEVLVAVAERLRAREDIVFVIAGEGGKKAMIHALIAQKKLSNCLLLPYQEHALLPDMLGSAAIGVVTLEASAAQLSVPSKTYNLLAAGCALLCIASPGCELELLLEKYKVGRRFDSEAVEAMADFICALQADSSLLNAYREKSRLAATCFTPENAQLYFKRMCQ